jgi:ADP-heptose:LPS heptosyltransferase
MGKVLVHRQGSLGDTVIALPCFHLIRASFPDSEIRVLTNAPVDDRAPQLFAVLDGSGLIDGYFEYPASLRDWRGLWRLAREIRRWGPDTAIYLMRRGRLGQVLRDAAFLLLCGARRIVGLPWRRVKREPQKQPDGLFEREAERLARCLQPLGVAHVRARAGWNLNLTEAEWAPQRQMVAAWHGACDYLVLGIGTKQPIKDWGLPNWNKVVESLLAGYSHKLVFVGADEDHPLAASLANARPDRCVNLCGMLSVRESAALIAGASLFVGVDSGPMHLADAVGTPLVSIFSRLSPPRIWFPLREHACILYPADGKTIASIAAGDVIQAVASLLSVETPDKRRVVS